MYLRCRSGSHLIPGIYAGDVIPSTLLKTGLSQERAKDLQFEPILPLKGEPLRYSSE